MAKVTIIYTGPIVDEIRKGMDIPRLFAPVNSYIDSPVFTEGFDNSTLKLGDKESYGRSIYATNVDDQAFLPGLIPMFSTAAKYAEFELAVRAAKEAEKAGTENEGITFEVEGYEEELYWTQQGRALADQGFEVTIAPANDAEPDPDPDSEP